MNDPGVPYLRSLPISRGHLRGRPPGRMLLQNLRQRGPQHASRHLRPFQLRPPGRPVDNRSGGCRPRVARQGKVVL